MLYQLVKLSISLGEVIMFVKNQRVLVSNAINFGGKSGWTDMQGTVKKVEQGWVFVQLDEATDKSPVPFRKRELSLIK